jgi:MFS family permease
MLLMHGTRLSFGIFFKPLLTEFGWTRATTAGAFSVSWIFQAISSVVMGNLNDKMGPRVVVTISGILFGLGYVLMSQITDVWQLYLFYGFLTGMGASGIVIALLSTIVRWFAKRRTLITSIIASGGEIGAVLIPLVAVRLIAAYDWRISYVVIGGSVLIIIVLLAQFLKRDPSQIKQTSDRGDKVDIEQNVKEFHMKEAVYSGQFWVAFSLQFINGFLLSIMVLHIVPHATDIGISPINAANILAIMGGVGIVGKIGVGIAGDKFGIRQTYMILFILLAASYFWLLAVEDLQIFYLFAIVFGLARQAGVLGSPLIAELFGLKAHGLLYGVMNLALSIGSAISAWMAGYIFDVTDSYMIVFLICGTLGIVAAILSSLLRPTRVNRTSI